MTPDELWEKYSCGRNFPIGKASFKMALKEYGESVRQQAVRVCKGKRYMTVDMSDECGFAKVDAMRYAANDCAAAIEKMPLS